MKNSTKSQVRRSVMKKHSFLNRMMLSVAVGLFLLTSGQAFAQRTVTGKVTDKADGSGLPGVNISVKGTTNGTSSNVDGTYSLSNVPDNATLVFSFVGYESQEISVGNQSVIDLALASDIKALEEVVVIGYGEAKRKDLTGAVTQVSSKDFNAGVNPNPLQAIQGKVAGLTITQPDGDPNTTPTVRLRGYTSLAGGSDPLYVVDGVIGVPINSIAPSDIETIDVLKDASASAIYGSRAANGVILITTKRGKSGKATVSFNNYIATEVVSNKLDLLDAQGYRDQVTAIKGAGSLTDKQRFPTDANGNNTGTDWFNEISRVGYTNNHNLGISGGGGTFTYRGSLDYINRVGIIKNTGFERATGRINIDQKALNNRLSIQYNLSLSNTNRKITNGNVLNRATTFLPTLPIRDNTGAYYEVGGSFDLFNPVAMQENFKNDEVYRVLIGGVNMRYEIIDGLTIGVNGAWRNENTVNSLSENGNIKAYANSQGRTLKNLYQTTNKLLETTLAYTKKLGTVSNLTVLGGYSYQINTNDGFGAFNNNYVNGSYGIISYNNLGLGRGTLLSGRSDYTSSYRNEQTISSFFGRATLNLLDRYNFTATLRQDGSSKFGANNKRALFPSVAVGWTISNESFLQGNKALSFLKLRVGYGQTGNSEGINPYGSLLLYGPKGNYYDGGFSDFVPGYGVIQNANPDLKWEVISQTNVGLDFELFNRVTGTVEFYNKSTKDMLYNYNVPADGSKYFVDNITANVGSMKNTGLELSLGGDAIQSKDFTWNVRVVASGFTNEITSLSGDGFDVPRVLYNSFGGRGLSNVFASQLREGHPLGEFLIPHFVGFDADGKVLMDATDGGTTSDYSKAVLKESGLGLVRYTGSLINNFKYKGFDLYFQIRGVVGNKILNNLRSNLAIPGSILETNMLKAVADYPTNYSTNQLSDLWLENGSFIRFDNWQIGYNIPVGVKTFSNARVYLGGNNLFIITKYKGVDPELQVKGDLQTSGGRIQQAPTDIGMDKAGIYPKTRSFQLGVNLTF